MEKRHTLLNLRKRSKVSFLLLFFYLMSCSGGNEELLYGSDCNFWDLTMIIGRHGTEKRKTVSYKFCKDYSFSSYYLRKNERIFNAQSTDMKTTGKWKLFNDTLEVNGIEQYILKRLTKDTLVLGTIDSEQSDCYIFVKSR